MVKLLDQELENTLLKDSVEGNESVWGLEIREGKPVINMRGIGYNAKADPKLLAEYLRSEIPISQDIRNWVADLLDPDIKGRVRLEFKRGRTGNAKKSRMEHLESVKEFMELKNKDGYDSALKNVSDRCGVPLGTFAKIVAKLEPAIIEHEKISRENTE